MRAAPRTCEHALVDDGVAGQQDGVARHDAAVRGNHDDVTGHELPRHHLLLLPCNRRVCVCVCVCVRERERQRERETERDGEGGREGEGGRQREQDIETEKEREKERGRERDGERVIEKTEKELCVREVYVWRDSLLCVVQRQRGGETVRQTERQTDRQTSRD